MKFSSILLLSSIASGLFAFEACAAVPAQSAEPVVPGLQARGATPDADGGLVRLAQAREVDVFYDEYGRRVVVDAYTGEVLAIERPRRGERRMERREQRRQDRYYLDDPDDVVRLNRDRDRRLRELGSAPSGRGDDYDYDYDAPEGYPDDPYMEGPADAFPPAPRRNAPVERAEPKPVRKPVERKPLPAPDATPGNVTSAKAEPATSGPARTGAIETTPDAGPTIIEAAPPAPVTLGNREEVAALQILLDRRGASPGVIDGRFGSNVDKAILAYRDITGENLKSTDTAGIKAALAATGGDPFTTYTITPEDAAGPYVAAVPEDYGQKAKLERLSYTSVPEMLAERFHMDEAFLKALNPGVNFGRPGTIIRVANIGKAVTGAAVTKMVADKKMKQLRAYDASGRLVVAYPATIGSSDTPSPTGVHAVSRIALNPEYTYNPNVNFKQGENDKILTIPPGPNGPVGSVWIALDKPTYGIHGTPEPSKIGKTESHGCVRLTNWDAQELTKLVKAGVPVEFVD